MIASVISLYDTCLGSQCFSVDNPFMISSDVNHCGASCSLCAPRMGVAGTLYNSISVLYSPVICVRD